MEETKTNKHYWTCIVGPTNFNELEDGADAPMRTAVDKEFNKVTGHEYDKMWSGWGANQEKADVLNYVCSLDENDPVFILLVTLVNRRFKK